MRRNTLFAVTVLLLAGSAVLAAGKILPQSVGRWSQIAGSDLIDVGASTRPSAGPMALQSILNEYGWISTEPVNYTTAPAGTNADDVKAMIFQMKDPTGAYGLYSYLRTQDMARADFADHSSMSPDHVLVLAGNLVLEVLGRDLGRFQPELKTLVTAAKAHAQDGPLPTLWQHLPQEGQVSRSDHYILGPQALNQLLPGQLGDSLGFQTGAEAELARYQLGGNEAALLILDFPTPQLAEKELKDLQKKFNVNGSGRGAGSPTLYAKRSVTLLAIVAGASTQAQADGLLAQVQSGSEVTWNEPTFQFKEPSIEVMIAGTIVAAGIICLFAIIAGVSFGALRLVVKRFFPGKVFDRKNHLEVLQLGLGSKPINSDDFYGYSVPAGKATVVDKDLPDRVALRIFR
jgi:hypothetical protein